MIPLPKLCSSAQIPLLLCCILQVISLTAKFTSRLTKNDKDVFNFCTDYLAVTLNMFVLLFVARKTARDLLLQNKMEQIGGIGMKEAKNASDSETNIFEETEFQGDLFNSHENMLVIPGCNRSMSPAGSKGSRSASK